MITTFATSRPDIEPLVPPSVTFYSLDDGSRVKAVDGLGVEAASFIVDGNRSAFTISRLVSPNTTPMLICSSHHSWLSGNTMMKVHGHEVKLNLDYHQTVSGTAFPPMGKMKWKGDLGGKNYNLVNELRQIVAKAYLQEKKMEVLVPADEMMLDFLLAGWVALIKAKHADGSTAEFIQAGVDAVSALAGGGGGGA